MGSALPTRLDQSDIFQLAIAIYRHSVYVANWQWSVGAQFLGNKFWQHFASSGGALLYGWMLAMAIGIPLGVAMG